MSWHDAQSLPSLPRCGSSWQRWQSEVARPVNFTAVPVPAGNDPSTFLWQRRHSAVACLSTKNPFVAGFWCR